MKEDSFKTGTRGRIVHFKWIGCDGENRLNWVESGYRHILWLDYVVRGVLISLFIYAMLGGMIWKVYM